MKANLAEIETENRQNVQKTRFFFSKSSGSQWVKKIKIGLLNPKEYENGFCLSVLNRSIRDPLDHGAAKEPKSPLWKRVPLKGTHPWCMERSS